MNAVTDRKKAGKEARGGLLRLVVLLSLLIGLTVLLFVHVYGSYTESVLYAERLEQMQEVTEQLFTGLENVVENQWYHATVQTNRILEKQPATAEQLVGFMKNQAELSDFSEISSDLIAVDNRGRYYTQNGVQGLLTDQTFLYEEPERISFVVSSATKERTQMFFLLRLAQPIQIQDGRQTVDLIYYGLARDMAELNPYFSCKAYNGQNAVYVVDEQGAKLFSGENGSDFLKGFNVYKTLQSMSYRHNTTFDDALNVLKQKGISYSNAVLDGTECYYALYKMNNTAWNLVFVVPAECVAVNTVSLVNSTTQIVLAFAVAMILICAAIIYRILRRQQKQVLRTAEENNAALAAANDELEQSNAALQQAQETTKEALQAAETANKAKTDFLSSMSHDIRTPMNAIIGITTLMKGEPGLSEKMREYLSKLEYSGDHLLELINNVLDMNRIESGKTTLHVESINLAEQVTQVETIIGAQAEQKRQHFTLVTTHLNHEHVLADAARLQQILVNILSNSVKYTAAGGHILFELEELPRDERYAKYKFIVQDDGMGMSEEFLKNIFDPFTREENSVTNQIQGTGLGMAITKSVVDLMGGVIHVDSTPGKGSRFEVTLEFPIDTAAEQNMQHLSILLVQCKEISVTRVRDAAQGKPIQIHYLPTVSKAVENLCAASYDVILTPLETSEEEVSQLRKAAGENAILLCGATSSTVNLIAPADADGVLPYPFFLSNLEAEVSRVQELRSAADGQEDVSPLRGMKFLCAEDNDINAEILEMLLETQGASCKICKNGQEIVDAFASVKPGDYDMILMDVQMPVMNGLEATRAIRNGENPLGKTIPIVAMTANAFLEDMEKSREAGMDEHLSKPVDMKALEQTVRRFKRTPQKMNHDKTMN